MAENNVAVKCPVCSSELTDLYPKPRCRRCGYIESCCQPEVPCEGVAAMGEPVDKDQMDVDRRR